MSKYSKEYSKMKGSAKSKLQEFIAGIKDGSIIISGNEPKMSIRALRTLLLSGDEVHGDLVESFLSGNLTTEQFKNKLRGASETRIPKPLRRIPTDRIHHLTPLELANIVENMPDNELFTLLQDYEKEGYFFGDTDQNVRGGSFDERAHTGARPKASKSKIVYPNELGEPGLSQMSAHPRGTRDTLFDVNAKPTTAAEAREIITPLLKQGEEDIQRGIIADTPRRSYINQQLVEKGVIEQGVDIFSANIDDATLKKAAPYLSSAEMQKGAALAFKTPTFDFTGGTVRTLTRIPPSQGELRKAQKLAKTVSGAAGEIPLAGYVAGPLLGYALGMSPGEAVASNLPGVSDIEGNELAVRERVPNTTDMFVDPRTNRVEPRTIEEAQSGPLGLAYKDGKPIAVPYGSVAGTADFMETVKQAGQQILDVNEARARRFFGNGAVNFTKGAAQLFFGI